MLLVLLLRAVVMTVVRRILGGGVGDPRRFWVRQGVQVVVAVVLVLGVVSIWITPGTNITTGIGLLSAGLALQRAGEVVSCCPWCQGWWRRTAT